MTIPLDEVVAKLSPETQEESKRLADATILAYYKEALAREKRRNQVTIVVAVIATIIVLAASVAVGYLIPGATWYVRAIAGALFGAAVFFMLPIIVSFIIRDPV